MDLLRRTIINLDRQGEEWYYSADSLPLGHEEIPSGRDRIRIFNPGRVQMGGKAFIHRFMAEIYFTQLFNAERAYLKDIQWSDVFPAAGLDDRLHDAARHWTADYFQAAEMPTLIDYVTENYKKLETPRTYAIFKRTESKDGKVRAKRIVPDSLVVAPERSEISDFLRKDTITPVHKNLRLDDLDEADLALYKRMVGKAASTIASTMVVFSTQPEDYAQLHSMLESLPDAVY